MRWLAWFAVGFGVLHLQGPVLAHFEQAGGSTGWAGWLSLLTPALVLFPAAFAIHGFWAAKRTWVAFAFGALAYAQGHGIQLSASSGGDDQLAGHYIWLTGLLVVIAALLNASATIERHKPKPVDIALAILVGVAFAVTAVHGGTEVLALGGALGFLIWVLLTRHPLRSQTYLTFLPALAILIVQSTIGQSLL